MSAFREKQQNSPFKQESSSDLRRYLENIINNIPHYIFWKDRYSRFLGCNENFAKSVNLASSKQIVGLTDYDLPWEKEESDIYIADDEAVMESGIPKINYEEMQRQLDGSEKTMLVSKLPIKGSNGKSIGILGIYSDITQQKRIEAELRKEKEKAETLNEAKRLFILNIQHDIRTPLSGIVPVMDLLENSDAAKQNQELFDAVRISVKRLLDYLNEIIYGGEAANQGVTVHERKFDVYDTINAVAELEAAKIKVSNLTMSVVINPDVPQIIIGDYFALKQTLLSLLSNAVKFTKEGSVQMVVKKMRHEGDKVILRFEIADTGEGIPEEKQEGIFELFAKLHCSNTETYKGQGIGLYLVKLYVDKLGGNIDLYSKFNEGTTVRLDLPFQLPLVDDCLHENALLLRNKF